MTTTLPTFQNLNQVIRFANIHQCCSPNSSNITKRTAALAYLKYNAYDHALPILKLLYLQNPTHVQTLLLYTDTLHHAEQPRQAIDIIDRALSTVNKKHIPTLNLRRYEYEFGLNPKTPDVQDLIYILNTPQLLARILQNANTAKTLALDLNGMALPKPLHRDLFLAFEKATLHAKSPDHVLHALSILSYLSHVGDRDRFDLLLSTAFIHYATPKVMDYFRTLASDKLVSASVRELLVDFIALSTMSKSDFKQASDIHYSYINRQNASADQLLIARITIAIEPLWTLNESSNIDQNCSSLIKNVNKIYSRIVDQSMNTNNVLRKYTNTLLKVWAQVAIGLVEYYVATGFYVLKSLEISVLAFNGPIRQLVDTAVMDLFVKDLNWVVRVSSAWLEPIDLVVDDQKSLFKPTYFINWLLDKIATQTVPIYDPWNLAQNTCIMDMLAFLILVSELRHFETNQRSTDDQVFNTETESGFILGASLSHYTDRWKCTPPQCMFWQAMLASVQGHVPSHDTHYALHLGEVRGDPTHPLIHIPTLRPVYTNMYRMLANRIRGFVSSFQSQHELQNVLFTSRMEDLYLGLIQAVHQYFQTCSQLDLFVLPVCPSIPPPSNNLTSQSIVFGANIARVHILAGFFLNPIDLDRETADSVHDQSFSSPFPTLTPPRHRRVSLDLAHSASKTVSSGTFSLPSTPARPRTQSTSSESSSSILLLQADMSPSKLAACRFNRLCKLMKRVNLNHEQGDSLHGSNEFCDRRPNAQKYGSALASEKTQTPTIPKFEPPLDLSCGSPDTPMDLHFQPRTPSPLPPVPLLHLPPPEQPPYSPHMSSSSSIWSAGVDGHRSEHSTSSILLGDQHVNHHKEYSTELTSSPQSPVPFREYTSDLDVSGHAHDLGLDIDLNYNQDTDVHIAGATDLSYLSIDTYGHGFVDETEVGHGGMIINETEQDNDSPTHRRHVSPLPCSILSGAVHTSRASHNPTKSLQVSFDPNVDLYAHQIQYLDDSVDLEVDDRYQDLEHDLNETESLDSSQHGTYNTSDEVRQVSYQGSKVLPPGFIDSDSLDTFEVDERNDQVHQRELGQFPGFNCATLNNSDGLSVDFVSEQEDRICLPPGTGTTFKVDLIENNVAGGSIEDGESLIIGGQFGIADVSRIEHLTSSSSFDTSLMDHILDDPVVESIHFEVDSFGIAIENISTERLEQTQSFVYGNDAMGPNEGRLVYEQESGDVGSVSVFRSLQDAEQSLGSVDKNPISSDLLDGTPEVKLPTSSDELYAFSPMARLPFTVPSDVTALQSPLINISGDDVVTEDGTNAWTESFSEGHPSAGRELDLVADDLTSSNTNSDLVLRDVSDLQDISMPFSNTEDQASTDSAPSCTPSTSNSPDKKLSPKSAQSKKPPRSGKNGFPHGKKRGGIKW